MRDSYIRLLPRTYVLGYSLSPLRGSLKLSTRNLSTALGLRAKEATAGVTPCQPSKNARNKRKT